MTVTPQPKEAALMANKDAVKKYQQSRDAFKIRPTKEEGEAIRAAAAASGTSVQAYILAAVREKIALEQNKKSEE